MDAAGMIRSQVSGLGLQVSGSGVQHQVQVQDPHPHPYPITRTWLPTAETRDPKMYTPANYPVPNLTKNNELRTKNG
jgi:hypothetical protein